MDTGSGGGLGPVNGKREFEFIPIPEASPDGVGARARGFRSYAELPNRYSAFKPIREYVAPKYRDWFAHDDPEFVTFTYGDPTAVKSRALLKLEAGDWLLFYAGLKDYEKGERRLFLIGYFVIENIFSGNTIRKHYKDLNRNAHIKRDLNEYGLVIAQGNSGLSRLLLLAEPVTEIKKSDRPYYPVLRTFGERAGCFKDIMRSSPFWLKPPSPSAFENYLSGLY